MKISLNWLAELVDLPRRAGGDVPDIPALTELLTLAGVEVEGIEQRGVAFDKVVVARILESSPHPNADRLSVCQVEDGSGKPRQIVCGAKNYKVGDKVPLALPGAVLPGDFRIKASKLRGVESEGMLCSAKELLLSEESSGLLILPESAIPGAPLSSLFPPDTILDLEITPNRPDLLSYIGMAREVAALSGARLKGPAAHLPDSMAPASPDRVEVTLSAEDLCSIYSATRIKDIRVGPSPAWLREKLESAGIRSINNVVDVTNFVLLESGQPLHAFDAATLKGGIQVRLARAGETLSALDGRRYPLDATQLVIADSEGPVALAGIMGGEETGVTAETREVVLESARFEPRNIRRTSRALGLMSDSSYRYERGVDPAGVLPAAGRATALILELAGGAVQAAGFAGAAPDGKRREVSLRYERSHALLGISIEPERIDRILAGFGLEKVGGEPSISTWRIPAFRQDLLREIDLIEEIARVHGIGNIPARHTASFSPASAADRVYDAEMNLRRRLAGFGFFEIRTPRLVSEKSLSPSFPGASGLLRIRNPLSEDQAILRPSLIGGLMAALNTNVRNGIKRLRLFELGRVFQSGEPEEETRLAILLTGEISAPYWREPGPRSADLFDLKGILSALGIGEMEFRDGEAAAGFAISLEILREGKPIGWLGQLSPADARAMDLALPLLIAEIRIPAAGLEPPPAAFREAPRYPAVTRDIAMLVPSSVRHAQITTLLAAANEPLLDGAELFDVFSDPSGEKVPPGQKSVAYSLTYRAKDRTLIAEEVNAAHARLKERLKRDLNVQFRE